MTAGPYAALSLLLIACTNPQPQTADSDSISIRPAPTQIRVSATRASLPPIDQADSSFRVFRSQLLAALARHDTTFVYTVLAPEIKNTFGGDDSIAGFRRIWQLDKNESAFWPTLTRVLQLGGKMQDSTFVAPYVYAFWPDSIDAFENVAMIEPPYDIIKRDEIRDTTKVYSPVGYRAFFAKRNARWMMLSLIAGD